MEKKKKATLVVEQGLHANLQQVRVGLAPVAAALLSHVPVELSQQEIAFPPILSLGCSLQETTAGERESLYKDSGLFNHSVQPAREHERIHTEALTPPGPAHLCSARGSCPWAACTSPLSARPWLRSGLESSSSQETCTPARDIQE